MRKKKQNVNRNLTEEDVKSHLEKFFKGCLSKSRIIVKDASKNYELWKYLLDYRGILIEINKIFSFFLTDGHGLSFAYRPDSPVKLGLMDKDEVDDLISNWEKNIKKASNFHVFPKL